MDRPYLLSPEKKAYIFAGRLIDGSGNPARKNVLIKIEAGRISSIVNDYSPGHLPDGVTDLSDATLVPGLVDCHVHLFMSGTTEENTRRHQLQFSYDEARIAITRHIERHRTCGIIGVRDGGDYGGFVSIYKGDRDIKKDDLVTVRSAGKAIHAPGRYGRFVGTAVPSFKDFLGVVSAFPLDHLKIINSGLNSLKSFGRETAPQFNGDFLREIVKFAKYRGLKVMVHANGILPVKEAVMAGADSIEHGFFMGRENMELMVSRGVTWVPTVYTMKACMETMDLSVLERDVARKNLEHQLEQIRLAEEIGVTIATGTDSGSMGVDHGISLFREMELFMEAGISLERTVRYASFNGARLLGIESRAGLIEPGMPALFTVLPVNGRFCQ